MAEKTGEKEGSKGAFSVPVFARRARRGKVDRKCGMKVKISHALDQIAIDVKKAVELYGRDMGTARPLGD